MMGYPHSHLSGITAGADVDRFLAATDMKRGAYGAPLVAGMPEAGTARHVTITLTRVNAVDAPLGTVTIAGTDLRGKVISEVITPLDNATATGTLWFRTVTAQTGGNTWVTAGGADQIEIGCGAAVIIAEAAIGTIHGIAVNTTAAGAITVADAGGTIAVLAASIVEDFYPLDATFGGYLSVTLVAASDITVLHSGSMPSVYA
jgi:hypothetical protein